MKKLTAVLVAGVILMWASAGFAQTYSALGNVPDPGPWFGVGAIAINGDNGAGNSDDAFLPTVNLSGLTEYLAWQVFYGYGTDTTVYGGNADYIFASNFDECFTCPTEGFWWMGVGPTMMNVAGLYFDENDATAAVDDTYFGGNLGFGYHWDSWAINVYAHYLSDQLAFQGMLLYSFGK